MFCSSESSDDATGDDCVGIKENTISQVTNTLSLMTFQNLVNNLCRYLLFCFNSITLLLLVIF